MFFLPKGVYSPRVEKYSKETAQHFLSNLQANGSRGKLKNECEHLIVDYWKISADFRFSLSYLRGNFFWFLEKLRLNSLSRRVHITPHPKTTGLHAIQRSSF